jgi:hypothetical protein
MFGHCIVFEMVLGVIDTPKLVPMTNAEIATAAKIKTR